MTGKKLAKGILATTAGALALMTASHAAAQTYAEFAASCVGTANVACIAQIGDGNNTSIDQSNADGSKAQVYIQGNNNGTGTIATIGNGAPVQLFKETVVVVPAASAPGKSDGHSQDGDKGQGDQHHQSDGKGNNKDAGATTTQLVLTPADRPITLPTNLPSGTITQRGSRNSAEVAILDGDDNDFYISQTGGNNQAYQRITGDRNLAVIIQQGELGARNSASEIQSGANNIAYVKQTGGGNTANLSQDGNSTILLEQENGFNTANLTQTGGANYIALRQTGGADISISQAGGRSIAIEQSAGTFGTSGLSVMQY
ncbi:hypothetical protein [Novosphingobium sp. JCM 18896]|uniref:hypothetical protein n=1 Tax=Novosphingobium sp. JCM 18896 TaxID=2989731 RepID=UPI002221364C|nr:hypothetical protein [Novosphingobium sp. JCM 18896]MCW1431593.1 hypothetical protein [Novosphingobium sp. JCM 18896]